MSSVGNVNFTSRDTTLESQRQNRAGAVKSLGLENHFLLLKTVLQLVRFVRSMKVKIRGSLLVGN